MHINTYNSLLFSLSDTLSSIFKDALVCYQYVDIGSIPGCAAHGIYGTNYCPLPFLYCKTRSKWSLNACEGNCDSDAECSSGDPVCGNRNRPAAISGCHGTGRRGSEYCRDPNMIATP